MGPPGLEGTISKYPGRWHFIGSNQELTSGAVQARNPCYILFLHWSWKVADDLITSVDISDTLNIKIQALSFYETEVRSFPHPPLT